MIANTLNHTRRWLKTSPHPIARGGLETLRRLRGFEVPAPAILFAPVYYLHRTIATLFAWCARVFYWTPLFRSRVANAGRCLYLYGGMPFLSGPLRIRIGERCRISGQSTFSGRTSGNKLPRLLVGDNVDIGWMTTIAVGSEVRIGNNVRIAGRAFLAGYPGHPIDAADRAAGLPDTDDQIGDIVIEDDAWIATGVTILPGVRIGRRSIIAAGSVVSKSIPDDVLAGGVPARPLKQLNREES